MRRTALLLPVLLLLGAIVWAGSGGAGAAWIPGASSQPSADVSVAGPLDPSGVPCADCHNRPTYRTRQVLDLYANGYGPGGDFIRTSHHVQPFDGTAQEADCLTCHDVSQHDSSTIVRLKDPDNPTNIIEYTSDEALEPFCRNCHDSNGANGDLTPFTDNKPVPPIPPEWASSAHKAGPTPLSCFGNGGCHANGHGSDNVKLLAPWNVGTPTVTPEGLCLTCHGPGGSAPQRSPHSNIDYTSRTQPPFSQTCNDCHSPHGSSNLHAVRTAIAGQTIHLTAQTGDDSYDDGFNDGQHDSICTTCHTTTAHNRNTSTELQGQGHNPVGTNCIACHGHGTDPTLQKGFMPSGGCTTCHRQPQGARRQIVDTNGDGSGTGGDFVRTSHHVWPGSGTVTDADCAACHDTSQHMSGSVRLKNADNPATVIPYTTPADLEPFCRSCHDADGAGGNLTPFSDGTPVPPVPPEWASSAHKSGALGLTCYGNGGCHANGHGSDNVKLLAPWNVGTPTVTPQGLCLACHSVGGPGPEMSLHSNIDYPDRTQPEFARTCDDCHSPHGSSNRHAVRTQINGFTVNLLNLSGDDSFDDGFDDGQHDSVCVACHTTTSHNRNTSTELQGQGHNPVGTYCLACHRHGTEPTVRSGFMPSGGCTTCHRQPQGTRRQIVDSSGDGTGSGGDFIRTSHHVQLSFGTVTDSDCTTCHDTSQHMQGTVRLKNVDNPATVIPYTTPADLQPFCQSCHDADGAGGNPIPFTDGITVPTISPNWPGSIHETQGLCLDCHGNGHGSDNERLFAPWNVGTPTVTADNICGRCHGPGGGATQVSTHSNIDYPLAQRTPMSRPCWNCHSPHGSSNNSLIRERLIVRACIDCHNPHGLGMPAGLLMSACTLCHADHQTAAAGVAPLAPTQVAHSSTNLHARTGEDSFDDGYDDAQHDSICVVCHSLVWHNNQFSTELRGTGHNPVGGDCITCHSHGTDYNALSGFMPPAVPTDTPTVGPSPTDTATPTPTSTPTVTPTPTDTATPTVTPAPTDTPTVTSTPTDTATPTVTPAPTDTLTPAPTDTPTTTPTPTETPMVTPTPTIDPTLDTDGDGMPDIYELAHTCLDRFTPDAGGDPDGDAFTSGAEHTLGTDPCDPDTDGDGFADLPDTSFAHQNLSAAHDNCPLVANADQANNDGNWIDNGRGPGDDITRPMADSLGDACDPDDDNDGLADAAEGVFPIPGCPSASAATDPLVADSDSDGNIDGYECAQGSDPANAASKPAPASGCTDADNDKARDQTEERGWGTSPAAADSDGDGMLDGVEIVDVDGNGVVSFNDALLIAKAAALGTPFTSDLTPAERRAFDVDRNGTVNFMDALLAARIANGFNICS